MLATLHAERVTKCNEVRAKNHSHVQRAKIVAIAVLGCVALSAWPCIATAAARDRTPKAPTHDLTFAATGAPFRLDRFRGKIVYVNLFASWCPPCNREAPMVASIARNYAARGLVVIGIDEGEDAGHALGFQKRYRLPYTIVVDPSSAVQRTLRQPSLPMHLFYDRVGSVSAAQIGSLDEAAAKRTIEKLLGSPPK